MESITSGIGLKALINSTSPLINTGQYSLVIDKLHNDILKKKVRFPLLESAAKELCRQIPEDKQIEVTDKIIDLKTIGGNVLAGIILQSRLPSHFDESIDKAIEYIIAGNEWYVCDITGERVQGYGLLTMPEKMLPRLRKMASHPDKWIVRSIGVAGHYAIKKGLKRQYVDEMFQLLLSLSNTTDFHTKKGIGWAAKTAAKFHPDIIEQYREKIDSTEVKQWFKTKIKIGLGRTDKYAGRYTS